MKKQFIHQTFFRILAPVIYGFLIYLLLLLINNNFDQIAEFFSNQEVYIAIALTYLSFESIRFISILLEKRITPDKAFYKIVSIQLGISLIISIGLISLALALYYQYVVGFSINARELGLFIVIYGISGLLYNLIYFSNLYMTRENKLLLENESKIRESLDAEIKSFRANINPELLYENLEKIIAYLPAHIDKADELIDLLAYTYRYQLSNRNVELISIQEELQSAKNFIALLNFHFNNSIRFSTNISEHDISMHLIPGTLNTLIEYFVRNSIFSTEHMLNIELEVEDEEYLILHCKQSEKLQQHEASKEAFKRLQRSYSFFSEKPFIQVKAYGENYIKLPRIILSTEPA